MAVRLLKKFSGADTITSVKVDHQFSRDVFVDGEKQAMRIDVFLIVNGTIAVIVEDKTYTGLHDDQINRYRKCLDVLRSDPFEGEELGAIQEIRTVFLKTGFLYDDDRSVKADVSIGGEDFLKLLFPYIGNSEILDSYLLNLAKNLQWYEEHGTYETNGQSFWDWNIAKHQIAQYKLMREIFPEGLWTDHDSWEYRVYHGTNVGGRPWTEMGLGEHIYQNSQDRWSAFWRIDTDNKGPYISLRFYEKFDKKDTAKRERHKNLYEAMSNALQAAVAHNEKLALSWQEMYPGYCGNYMEADLLHIGLKDNTGNQLIDKRIVINVVNKITNLFFKIVNDIDI
jgi:hypothetical protein